jgi:group I intron endonuclease
MTATTDSRPYGIIYCVTHVSTGRVYIGQTVQSMQDRWTSHKANSYCVVLHRAIKKYGQGDFSIEEIDRADSKDELDILESFYIAMFGSTNRAMGFNLMSGGSFGKHSDESKQKMSVSVRKAYENPEFKAKLIAAKTGVKHSPERVAKAVIAHTGKTATDAAKKNLSAARTKLWKDPVASENMRQASIAARKSEEYKATVAANTSAQWADPEQKEKLKTSQAAGKAAFWADPVKRAARIEKRRATFAAKKAAQI